MRIFASLAVCFVVSISLTMPLISHAQSDAVEQAPEEQASEMSVSEGEETEGEETEGGATEVQLAEVAPKTAPVDLAAPEVSAEFVFLESQIKSGEAQEALQTLNATIKTITDRQHRYDAELYSPIMLRGDAYHALGSLQEALEEYDRARHIARVNQGLFDPSQIPAVYRQAKVLRELGDLAEAGRREEYAYEVARRSYDDYAVELLQPINRLADFYLQANNPLAARSLLNRAFLIHAHHKTTGTDESIAVLRALATSHRVERFPPNYTDSSDPDEADQVFSARLGNDDLREQYRGINSFPAGERALQRIVEVQQKRFGDGSDQAMEALLELADWHLMFGKNQAAYTFYEHIYLTLEGETDIPSGLGERRFAQPVLLYFPRPPDLKPPRLNRRGEQRTGLVALTFGVSPTGGVRQLKTLQIDGPENMNYRVRRSMRQAVFRPRLEDGLAVTTADQEFAYRFPYFEKLDPPGETETAAEKAPLPPDPTKNSKKDSTNDATNDA